MKYHLKDLSLQWLDVSGGLWGAQDPTAQRFMLLDIVI